MADDVNLAIAAHPMNVSPGTGKPSPQGPVVFPGVAPSAQRPPHMETAPSHGPLYDAAQRKSAPQPTNVVRMVDKEGNVFPTVPTAKLADAEKMGLSRTASMWDKDGNNYPVPLNKVKDAQQLGLSASKPAPGYDRKMSLQDAPVPNESGGPNFPKLPGQDPLNIMKTQHFDVPRSASEQAMGVVKGVAGLIPGLLAKPSTDMEKRISTNTKEVPGAGATLIAAKRLLIDPQVAEFKKGGATKGSESAAHYLASALPMLGPMAASSGEAFKRGEGVEGALTGMMALGGARGLAGTVEKGSIPIRKGTANMLDGYITRMMQRGYGTDASAARAAGKEVRPFSKLKNQEAQMVLTATKAYKNGEYIKAQKLIRAADAVGVKADAVAEGRARKSLYRIIEYPQSFTEGVVMAGATAALWDEVSSAVSDLVSSGASGGAEHIGAFAMKSAAFVALRETLKSMPSKTARAYFGNKFIELIRPKRPGPSRLISTASGGGPSRGPSSAGPGGGPSGPSTPPTSPVPPQVAITTAIQQAAQETAKKYPREANGRFTRKAGPNPPTSGSTAAPPPKGPNGPTPSPAEPVKPTPPAGPTPKDTPGSSTKPFVGTPEQKAWVDEAVKMNHPWVKWLEHDPDAAFTNMKNSIDMAKEGLEPLKKQGTISPESMAGIEKLIKDGEALLARFPKKAEGPTKNPITQLPGPTDKELDQLYKNNPYKIGGESPVKPPNLEQSLNKFNADMHPLAKKLPKELQPPFKPEGIKAGSSPFSPPGDRWTGNRGAIPGEVGWELDRPTGNDDSLGKAGIIENDNHPGPSTFTVFLADHTELGTWGDLNTAAKAAEHVIGKPPTEGYDRLLGPDAPLPPSSPKKPSGSVKPEKGPNDPITPEEVKSFDQSHGVKPPDEVQTWMKQNAKEFIDHATNGRIKPNEAVDFWMFQFKEKFGREPTNTEGLQFNDAVIKANDEHMAGKDKWLKKYQDEKLPEDGLDEHLDAFREKHGKEAVGLFKEWHAKWLKDNDGFEPTDFEVRDFLTGKGEKPIGKSPNDEASAEYRKAKDKQWFDDFNKKMDKVDEKLKGKKPSKDQMKEAKSSFDDTSTPEISKQFNKWWDAYVDKVEDIPSFNKVVEWHRKYDKDGWAKGDQRPEGSPPSGDLPSDLYRKWRERFQQENGRKPDHTESSEFLRNALENLKGPHKDSISAKADAIEKEINEWFKKEKKKGDGDKPPKKD